MQHVISKDGSLPRTQYECRAETEGKSAASEEINAWAEEPFLKVVRNFRVFYIKADKRTITSYVLDVATVFLDAC